MKQSLETLTVSAVSMPRPFSVKVINGVGKFLNLLGFDLVSLDKNRLMASACKKAGLTDFGENDFHEGFDVLLKALHEEAQLNTMGKLVAMGMITDLLVGRLQIVDALKRNPKILEQEIKQPIIIAGLPRTGTTVLQGLLSCDPASRFLYTWESMYPVEPAGKDVRVRDTDKKLSMLHKFLPGFQAIHETGAMLPQECLALMAFNFTSMQFDLNFYIPSYAKWYAQKDLVPTLQFHKKCLQLLQSSNPAQYWVLKTPPYVGAIDALLQVYPDARIIQTHREPSELIASVSSLFHALQAFTSDQITPAMTGELMLTMWSRLLNKGIHERAALAEAASQFYDMHFEAVLNEPVEELKKIYQHFSMPFTAEVEAAMNAYLQNNQQHKFGKHEYSLAMFGLVDAQVNEVFADYRAHNGMAKH